MATSDLSPFFEERYAEIEAYLSFLQNVEDAAQQGTPRFKRTDVAISPDQKRILNSSFYLQLYNLVEATVLRCLEAVTAAVEEAERRPNELSIELRNEWVRSVARTHGNDLSPKKRLEAALDLCAQLLDHMPVKNFKIDIGGGGNWDDIAIEELCKRVGCGLILPPAIITAAKRHVRDDLGALKLVKHRRNGLAHGSLSFVDCSDGVTVTELRQVADSVGAYLREAVQSFTKFINTEIADRTEILISQAERSEL